MTVSIFTIERRKNFPAAFSKFFEDLQSSVTTSTGDSYKMFAYYAMLIVQKQLKKRAICPKMV